MDEKKYVYMFKEGNTNMKDLLGVKGANLSEIASLDMPIPEGFIISTEASNLFFEKNEKITAEILNQIDMALKLIEQSTGKILGDSEKPLFLSVRSGTRKPIYGIMDTILNLGINDETVKVLAKKDRRFAYDTYRRFIRNYSKNVKKLPDELFENAIKLKLSQRNLSKESEMDANDLEDLVKVFKEIYFTQMAREFPQDTRGMLIESIISLYKLWNSEEVLEYKRENEIKSEWGTAIVIQRMVFGNLGADSASGIVFSRDPFSGENKITGKFIINSQGEDLLSNESENIEKLRQINDDLYRYLERNVKKLEKNYKDMQEVAFVIENESLYFLQTRNGKRTVKASIEIADDMVNEGIIDEQEALLRIDTKEIQEIFDKKEDKLEDKKVIYSNINNGNLENVFSKAGGDNSLKSNNHENNGEDNNNNNDNNNNDNNNNSNHNFENFGSCENADNSDVEDIKNLGEIENNTDLESLIEKKENYIENIPENIKESFNEILNWADQYRRLKIKVTANNEEEAKYAYKYGAEGIGLCETEKMFINNEGIEAIQNIILGHDEELKNVAIEKLLKHQRENFETLYNSMPGYNVTIRLLDLSMEKFLPKEEKMAEVAKRLNVDIDELKQKISKLREKNSILGFRGCRACIVFEDIAKMQTRAIIEAAINVNKNGKNIMPEIVIPLISNNKELKYLKQVINSEIKKVIKEHNVEINYHIGIMLETPRATLLAGSLAKDSEFFLIGTDDLTQMTFGFSKEDSENFINEYYKKGIFDYNPFKSLDKDGVGTLIKNAIELGKGARSDLRTGISGTYVDNLESIEFYNEIGLNYISCLPNRVASTKIAAAQAEIMRKRKQASEK